MTINMKANILNLMTCATRLKYHKKKRKRGMFITQANLSLLFKTIIVVYLSLTNTHGRIL